MLAVAGCLFRNLVLDLQLGRILFIGEELIHLLMLVDEKSRFHTGLVGLLLQLSENAETIRQIREGIHHLLRFLVNEPFHVLCFVRGLHLPGWKRLVLRKSSEWLAFIKYLSCDRSSNGSSFLLFEEDLPSDKLIS